MDPSRAAFDWNHARAFLATVDTGSLSAAARVLGTTQPTVGRQVAALERTLGVVLFERVGRGLALTPTGRAMADRIREMEAAAAQVTLIAAGHGEGIDGELRITASDIYSARLLPPVLRRLRRQAPRLRIEVVATNDIRDLQRREADIAIRHVRPTQPDLIARRIADGTGGFYAAPAYLAARGRPQTLADLSEHDFVGFEDIDEMIAYLAPLGVALTRANFGVTSANGIVGWEMVRAGLGIGVMDAAIAARTEGVVPALPDPPRISFPIWLTTHRELHTSPRIRLVFDLLADAIADHQSAQPRPALA